MVVAYVNIAQYVKSVKTATEHLSVSTTDNAINAKTAKVLAYANITDNAINTKAAITCSPNPLLQCTFTM